MAKKANRKPDETPPPEVSSRTALRDLTLMLLTMVMTGVISYHLLVQLAPDPDKSLDLTPTSSAGGYYTRWGRFLPYATAPQTWHDACVYYALAIGLILPLSVMVLRRHFTGRREKKS